MPIQVFADESKGTGQFMVMVGVLGHRASWSSFANEWQSVLNEKPPVPAFHMYDAMKHQKEFRRWSAAERESRIRKLVEAVNGFDLRGLLVAVDVEAHKKIIADDLRQSTMGHPKEFAEEVQIMRAFLDPYFFCFHFMVLGATRYLAKMGWTERFSMIFDEKKGVGERVRRHYPLIRHWICRQHPDWDALMPVDPDFESDEEFIPLQLSDMASVGTRLSLDGDHTWDWVVDGMSGLKWTEEQLVLDRERLLAMTTHQSERDPGDLTENLRLLGIDRDLT